MTDEQYDVVIVGGGIAGATVARTIADTGGKRILILEAGRATGMSADKYASHVEEFQASLVNVPNTPYPNNPNAPQADVLDIKQILSQPSSGGAPSSVVDANGYLVQTGPLPFQSDFTRALGGTTLHWLGTCLRMLPNDFELRSLLRPRRRLADRLRRPEAVLRTRGDRDHRRRRQRHGPALPRHRAPDLLR